MPPFRWNSLTSPLNALPEPLSSEYELQNLLGTGAYALVYQVRNRSTGKDFALKVVEKPPLAARALLPQLQREIEQLRAFANTPNVVQLCEVVDTINCVFLLFELCERSLDELVLEEGALDEEDALQWFRQALLGVRELHAVGTVHRDIKPSNMLIDSEGVLRICDFGWACREDEALTGMSGTPQYAPPEMLQMVGPPHTVKVDVYSLGACLQHLLLGRMPNAANDLPVGISPEITELLAELMHNDPESRPSVEELLDRPALQLGTFAQLWWRGLEFITMLGHGKAEPTVRSRQPGSQQSTSGEDVTGTTRRQAVNIPVESSSPTPPPMTLSGGGHAACWSRMASAARLPCMAGQLVPPGHCMSRAALRAPTSPSRRIRNGFCVSLNGARGHTGGHVVLSRTA
jgi:serine/threonine protein kinase